MRAMFDRLPLRAVRRLLLAGALGAASIAAASGHSRRSIRPPSRSHWALVALDIFR
jgi:hypothetical protein